MNAAERIGVLVLFIDTIRPKNLRQLQGLSSRGIRFTIITTDSYGDSAKLGAKAGIDDVHCISGPGIRRRFVTQLFRTLRNGHHQIAEVYPDSFLNLLGLVLAKLWGLRICLIARGAEYQHINGLQSFRTWLPFRLSYYLADFVIYKEPYMEHFARSMAGDSIAMLPNAVESAQHLHRHYPDDCEFIFLNSLRPVRYPELALQAFLEVCAEDGWPPGVSVRFRIVGLLGPRADPRTAKKEADVAALMGRFAKWKDRVELLPWTAVSDRWLDGADVFLLPSEVVYGNFSLLEAMSRGVVPIVTKSPGVEQVIEHQREGYVLGRDVAEWKQAMKQMAGSAELRRKMGAASRARVAAQFGITDYLDRYFQIYREILRKPGRAPLSNL